MEKMTFEKWLGHVDTLVREESSLGIADLPDCPYRDWYVKGMGSRTAAGRAMHPLVPYIED